MGIYIELFHGRKPRGQHLDNWGSEGPIFGPFDFVHTTYAYDIKLGINRNTEGELHVDDDMVFYDGVWYGDWSVFSKIEKDHKPRIAVFDQKKAIVPKHKEDRSACQACGKEWADEDLNEPRALSVRVEPGEPMPSGECPHCGSLCQPI